MAARQGAGAVGRVLARGGAGAAAGDLSLHRQQSGRGGAGQAPAGRGDDRPSDAAAQRRRPDGAAGRARRPDRGICRRRRPRSRAACAISATRSSSAPGPTGWRPMRPGARRAQPRGHRQARRPALRHQGARASATACTSSAGAGRDDAPARAGRRARRRCWPRSTAAASRAGAGRRAVARPGRRAADRPQPHLDRSARHPDAHRRGDRRARRRRGRAPLPAGSRRAIRARW